MSEVSPAKVKTWGEAVDDHAAKISVLDNKVEAAQIELCLACHQADEELGSDSRRPLINKLGWSESRFSKCCTAGKMIAELPEARRELLPNSSSTIYLLAALDTDTREKAFEEGIVAKDLSRRYFDSWRQQFNGAPESRHQQRVLATIYDPVDFTQRTTLINELKLVCGKTATRVMFADDKAKVQRERQESRQREAILDVAIKMYGADVSLGEAKQKEALRVSRI